MRDSAFVSVGMRPVVATVSDYTKRDKNGKHIHKQANVLTPSMFMAQDPQIPSLQLLRNVRVGSTSFLMRMRASSIIGPVLLRSRV